MSDPGTLPKPVPRPQQLQQTQPPIHGTRHAHTPQGMFPKHGKTVPFVACDLNQLWSQPEQQDHMDVQQTIASGIYTSSPTLTTPSSSLSAPTPTSPTLPTPPLPTPSPITPPLPTPSPITPQSPQTPGTRPTPAPRPRIARHRPTPSGAAAKSGPGTQPKPVPRPRRPQETPGNLLKRRLVDSFARFSSNTISEEQIQAAKDCIHYGGPSSTRYVQIPFDAIMTQNQHKNDHLTMMTSAYDLLLTCVINLMKPRRPQVWRSIKTNNTAFRARVSCMEGAEEILRNVGYSVVTETAMQFPEHITEPNKYLLEATAAELLMAKLEVDEKNAQPPSTLQQHPLQSSSDQQQYQGITEATNIHTQTLGTRPTPVPRPRVARNHSAPSGETLQAKKMSDREPHAQLAEPPWLVDLLMQLMERDRTQLMELEEREQELTQQIEWTRVYGRAPCWLVEWLVERQQSQQQQCELVHSQKRRRRRRRRRRINLQFESAQSQQLSQEYCELDGALTHNQPVHSRRAQTQLARHLPPPEVAPQRRALTQLMPLCQSNQNQPNQPQPRLDFREMKRLAEEKARKHFEDAMENGYVECTITTCAVTGAAGSGKTHTMSLVFNEDPPAVHESTGLCVPVRAISTVVGAFDSSSSEWTRVDEDKVLNKVADATSVTNTNDQPTVQSSQETSSTPESSDTSDTEGSSHTSQKPGLEKQASHDAVVDVLLEKLARLLRMSKGRRLVTKLDFLYFLDSGGQPQFHELLPSFVPNLSAILFVLKLSEKLGHNPKIDFYKEGKLVCSYQSPFSHEQILKRCIRALKHEKRSTENSSSTSPCIAMVGTHRDLELSCEGETRQEKDQKLLDLLQPRFGKSLIFYKNLEELIFPVNAREPSEEDRAVADILREAITSFSTPKAVRIPLPWFILEQVLRKLAKERGTGVMHIDRCREVAKRLHIEDDAFDAALEYLVSLNIFLYYPTVLPNVLFCEPQVALDKINELVECYHTLCGGYNTLPGNPTSKSMTGLSGKKWMRFQSHGVFREKLLHDRLFSGNYDCDLFTPSDLLKLLESLHIVGKVNTTDVISEYVMPSLLCELKPDKLAEHRCNPATSPAAPLLVHFPNEWPASGVFCSFLTSLLSTCNWEVMIDSRNKPTCLYRNCLEFQHSNMLGKITLIDSFDQGYFEVHVHASVEECEQFCPNIRQALFSALPCKAPQAKLAYFCPKLGTACCSSSLHLAHILPQRHCWRCSEKPGEVYGSLANIPNIKVWGVVAGISTSESHQTDFNHNPRKEKPKTPESLAPKGGFDDTELEGLANQDIKAGRARYPEFLSHADSITAANLSAPHSTDDHMTESLSLMDLTVCSRCIDGDLTLLAAALDSPNEDMSTIRSKYKNVPGQALQMLKKWQSSGTHTRQELIKILQSTGFSRAAHILTTSPESTPTQQGAKESGVCGIVTQATGRLTEGPKVGYQNPTAGAPTKQAVNNDLSDRPTLTKLLNFPIKSGSSINIPRQIGTKYFQFGIQLLNDETGAEIEAIVSKYREEAEQINLKILRLWIGGKGKPLDWDNLIQVLRAIGLGTLANDIWEGLH